MPKSELSSNSCCLNNDVLIQHGEGLEDRRASKFVQLSLVRIPRTIPLLGPVNSFCNQVSVYLRLNRAYCLSLHLKAIQLCGQQG
jgi:hypothetical protein